MAINIDSKVNGRFYATGLRMMTNMCERERMSERGEEVKKDGGNVRNKKKMYKIYFKIYFIN